VIGLSLAWELAGRGLSVRIVERGEVGREASWAGAGILPPGVERDDDPPYDRLFGLSRRLHATWAERLRQDTGIDNGYRPCGGIYLARDGRSARALHTDADCWRRRGVEAHELDAAALADIEPALQPLADSGQVQAAYLLPGEGQLRNPRHLKALTAACLGRGVRLDQHLAVDDVVRAGDRIECVRTSSGDLTAGSFAFCGGAWTAALLSRLGVHLALRPVRGQIVLLRGDRPPLDRVVNEGPRYLVPRPDGRVLIGSTEEEAGFDRRTTSAGIAGLLDFGLQLVPALRDLSIERTWAGLRPATADGLPYLGRIPGVENGYAAAGHFRAGLTLSPGTATVLAQLIAEGEAALDLAAFRLDR